LRDAYWIYSWLGKGAWVIYRGILDVQNEGGKMNVRYTEYAWVI